MKSSDDYIYSVIEKSVAAYDKVLDSAARIGYEIIKNKMTKNLPKKTGIIINPLEVALEALNKIEDSRIKYAIKKDSKHYISDISFIEDEEDGKIN